MRISLILLFGVLMLMLYSCEARLPSDFYDEKPNSADDAPFTPPEALDGIPTPESYEKQASFDSITYTRPDTVELLDLIERAEELAKTRGVSYDTLVAAINDADSAYGEFSTMLTYLSIKTSKDSTDAYYAEEYSFLSEAATDVKDEIEELLVNAAHSEHAENLEKNIFGEGFIEKYSSEKLTDRAIALMLEETRLENEYSALSPTTVIIEYNGKEASYAEIVENIKTSYSSNPQKLTIELKSCEKLYEKELERSAESIFIKLLRIRRLIANELGYESYTEYAYETIYHDYSPEDMEKLCDNIAKYVVPVMASLNDKVFYNYFTKNHAPKIDVPSLSSSIGSLYRGFDTELAGAYGFMEHYSLMDIALSAENRDSGAYTTYLLGIDAPFVFMSAKGNITDYTVLAHEFGHFYDALVNDGNTSSLDILELSSQSLELLTLDMLGSALSEKDYRYLYYYEMQNALITLIYQSFYSSFEHEAYSLEYNEITEENLLKILADNAERMHLPKNYFNDLSFIITNQTMLYPHYVQSYAVSLVPSLEIFFNERAEGGSGLSTYKALIERGSESNLISTLRSVSLSSPFEEKTIKNIVDEIYFSILGYHYYKEFDFTQDAA